jgi:hypothetical protein
LRSHCVYPDHYGPLLILIIGSQMITPPTTDGPTPNDLSSSKTPTFRSHTIDMDDQHEAGSSCTERLNMRSVQDVLLTWTMKVIGWAYCVSLRSSSVSRRPSSDHPTQSDAQSVSLSESGLE